MFLLGDQAAWIALWFDWKPKTGYDPTRVVNTVRSNQNSELLAEFKISLNLTKRMITTDEWFYNTEGRVPRINELNDSAFLPRTFAVRLEKGGKFLTAADGRLETKYHHDCPKFGMRLVMNPSPFPAREGWQDPTNGAEQSKFWEVTEFVSKQLSEAEARDSWWDIRALLRRFGVLG